MTQTKPDGEENPIKFAMRVGDESDLADNPGGGGGGGGGLLGYQPLKTGQTTSYATGDDGTHQAGVARSYTDNGDGTITDNAMNLIWQKCSIGKNNDSTCSGPATKANWTDAENYCSSLTLAGKTWRLPTVQELQSLVDYGTLFGNPFIDATYFPSTIGTLYWSSTTYAPSTDNAWIVDFEKGSLHQWLKTIHDPHVYVRCVSGNAKGYVDNFTDNGNGTVKHNSTGLIWQKCSRGQNNDATCSGTTTTANWSTAITYCNGLSLASRTWRLPSVNELKTIVDTTGTAHPIDTTYFPGTVTAPAHYYWSSTTYAISTSSAWVVDFNSGNSKGANEKILTKDVRCVSGP